MSDNCLSLLSSSVNFAHFTEHTIILECGYLHRNYPFISLLMAYDDDDDATIIVAPSNGFFI